MKFHRMLFQSSMIMKHIFELFDFHKIVSLKIFACDKILLFGQTLDFVFYQVSDYNRGFLYISQLEVKMTSHFLLLYDEQIAGYIRERIVI